ncbi:MAG TPA: hypothetical protein VKR61_13230 [Bryobacteraceae bacterium]|nr:hypothetical protein [Bryobacteraceae bacterium]
MQHSVWLLFIIAAGLILVVRGGGTLRTGSIWVLGCAVLAFIFSFALRDAVRKMGHRNTEDRLVNDVKHYLQAEPAAPATAPAVAALQPAGCPGDAFVPTKAADFVQERAAELILDADLVVFDAFPVRKSTCVRWSAGAVLVPAESAC